MSDHIETLEEERAVLIRSIRRRANRIVGYGQLRVISASLLVSLYTIASHPASRNAAVGVAAIGIACGVDLALLMRSQREASRITEDAGRIP